MKCATQTYVLLLFLLLFRGAFAQSAQQKFDASPQRISFMLQNNIGYDRMFRVEGPGIAFGFSMDNNEKAAHTWPVGSQLFFSQDGEKRGDLLFTLKAEDAGKTLVTFPGTQEQASVPAQEQPAPASSKKPQVTLFLRNNSIGFRKLSLISYAPGEKGNGTYVFTLAPYASSRREFLVGTKLYFASPEQVDLVMSGKSLDTNKPFLIVQQEQQGKTFDIFE